MRHTKKGLVARIFFYVIFLSILVVPITGASDFSVGQVTISPSQSATSDEQGSEPAASSSTGNNYKVVSGSFIQIQKVSNSSNTTLNTSKDNVISDNKSNITLNVTTNLMTTISQNKEEPRVVQAAKEGCVIKPECTGEEVLKQRIQRVLIVIIILGIILLLYFILAPKKKKRGEKEL